MNKIFTFDGKGNGILPLLKNSLKLNPRLMHEEINAMHQEMISALDQNGLKYSSLKSALVPHLKKEECGFLFDTSKIESVTYGYEVLDKVIPLLNKKTTQSILLGDLIGKDKTLIVKILKKYVVSSKPFDIKNSRDIFCQYINNLSKSMLDRLHKDLSKYEPYEGYIPATYSTPAKAYLSSILCNGGLKYKSTIILGHEDDRADTKNVNLGAPAFEDYGFDVTSIKEKHVNHFLSYKIESSLPDFHKAENYFSINLLSEDVINIDSLNIILEPEKYEYILREKHGKMKKSGVVHLSPNELVNLIKEKIQLTYIYNLEYLTEHNVSKFNIMIEVKPTDRPPVKLLVAAEYIFEKNALRIITLH